MDELSCPHCGTSILNDPRLAGQVVACRLCKGAFQMPAAALAPIPTPAPPAPAPAETGTEFQFDTGQPPPLRKPALSRPSRAPSEPALTPASSRPAPVGEPWFYTVPEKYAPLALGLGLGLVGVGLLLLVLLIIGLIRTGEFSLFTIGAVVLGLGAVILLGLGAVFGVAMGRLLVETARTLRAVRHHLEKDR